MSEPEQISPLERLRIVSESSPLSAALASTALGEAAQYFNQTPVSERVGTAEDIAKYAGIIATRAEQEGDTLTSGTFKIHETAYTSLAEVLSGVSQPDNTGTDGKKKRGPFKNSGKK